MKLFEDKITAGFPSPAEGYSEGTLDLNKLCVKDKVSTFFARASGESMIGAGIFDGDVMVIDKSIEAKSNDIIIAFLDGEFTVKRLLINPDKTVTLLPKNINYKPIEVPLESDFLIWGVVTFVIHKTR